MIASQCSLDSVRRMAATDGDLAHILSFVQVEHGFKELEACWDGFVHSSDDYGVTFKNKRDVANNFGALLSDFFDLQRHEFEPAS